MLFNDYLNTAEGATLYDNLKIDDATKQSLADWFGYRCIIPYHFRDFYRRELALARDRYYSILRIETTKIDWTITEYLEEMSENEDNTTGTSTSTKTGTRDDTSTGNTVGTTTSTGTQTTTSNNTDAKNGTAETTNNGTDTKKDTGTSKETDTNKRDTSTDNTQTTNNDESRTEKTVTAQKQAPQSIAYSNADAGMIPALDWQYMTAQGQTEKDTSAETNTTTTDEGTTSETGSATKTGETTADSTATTNSTSKTTTTDTATTEGRGTATNDSTTKTTNDDTRTTTGKTSENDSTETTSKANALHKAIRSGHNGELAEIFDRALKHIKATNSLTWLLGRLDSCFLMVYDWDEEETE